jgi:hypothetical protein
MHVCAQTGIFSFQRLSASRLYGGHRNKNPVAFKRSYDSNKNFDQDNNTSKHHNLPCLSPTTLKQIINEDFCDVNTR